MGCVNKNSNPMLTTNQKRLETLHMHIISPLFAVIFFETSIMILLIRGHMQFLTHIWIPNYEWLNMDKYLINTPKVANGMSFIYYSINVTDIQPLSILWTLFVHSRPSQASFQSSIHNLFHRTFNFKAILSHLPPIKLNLLFCCSDLAIYFLFTQVNTTIQFSNRFDMVILKQEQKGISIP